MLIRLFVMLAVSEVWAIILLAGADVNNMRVAAVYVGFFGTPILGGALAFLLTIEGWVGRFGKGLIPAVGFIPAVMVMTDTKSYFENFSPNYVSQWVAGAIWAAGWWLTSHLAWTNRPPSTK